MGDHAPGLPLKSFRAFPCLPPCQGLAGRPEELLHWALHVAESPNYYFFPRRASGARFGAEAAGFSREEGAVSRPNRRILTGHRPLTFGKPWEILFGLTPLFPENHGMKD